MRIFASVPLLGLAVGLAACTGSAPVAAPRVPGSSPAPVASATQSPTPPPVSCRSQPLRAAFYFGGLGAGHDLGGVRIRTLGPVPCLLTGAVDVVPLAAGGTRIRTAWPWRHRVTGVRMVLGGHGRRPVADVVLGGLARDDPRPPHRACRAADEVTPAWWQVRVAGHLLVVSNADRRAGRTAGGGGPGVYGCRGAFLDVRVGSEG